MEGAVGLPRTRLSLEIQSSEPSTFKEALSRDILMKSRARSVTNDLHTMETGGE